MIKPVPWFWECLEVLCNFMELKDPPEVVVRASTSILLILYRYVDASGGGFGNF